MAEVFVQGAGARGQGGTGANGSGVGGDGGDGGFARRIIDVTSFPSIDYHLGAGSGSSGVGGTGVSVFGQNGTLPTTALAVTVVAGAITAIAPGGALGSGMTIPPLIFIEPSYASSTGAGGTGATATVQIAAGAVTGITVTNGGSGYVSGQVLAWYGVGGNPGSTGTQGSGDVTIPQPTVDGADGADGLGFGMIKNFPMSPTGIVLKTGEGGAGVASNGWGGDGGQGGIYIRSYK